MLNVNNKDTRMTSKMELFVKIVNGWKALNTLTKSSISYVILCSGVLTIEFKKLSTMPELLPISVSPIKNSHVQSYKSQH